MRPWRCATWPRRTGPARSSDLSRRFQVVSEGSGLQPGPSTINHSEQGEIPLSLPPLSLAARTALLDELHVGVMSVTAGPDRAPLTTPVWYLAEPDGRIHVITGGRTRKATLLRTAGRAALCVQDERSPYRSVTVEGAVTVSTVDPDIRRRIAERYLDPDAASVYLSMTAPEEPQMVLVTLVPERYMTADFGPLLVAMAQ
ncbi:MULTISPECIES: pyridoxamine 5'-phosphate oxidase family protein [Streptosporangium]|uniref:pyridoxamine 5'-phosphate oxidase family protein n=1 Tax=Streptosporangium TaxID=2000 RepID=UPI003520DDBD